MSTHTNPVSTNGAAVRSREARAGVALWVLQIITALLIMGAGLGTVGGGAQPVAMFEQIGTGDWFRYLTGTLEIAGAIGLLIPRLAGLAAIALALLWVGAVGTHLFVIGGSPAPALVFLVLTGFLGWARRVSIVTLLKGGDR